MLSWLGLKSAYLRLWDGDFQLNQFGVWHGSDRCETSDRVQIPTNEIEQEQKQRLDHVNSKRCGVEEE